MNKHPILFSGERHALEALKAANDGLDKYQAAGQLDISMHLADINLHLLCERGFADLRGNRYYINDAGIEFLAQPMLPGMDSIT